MSRSTVASLVVVISAAVLLLHPMAQAATRGSTIVLKSEKITLPFGQLQFPGKGPGAAIANTHCAMCHSRGFIDTQPPLSHAAWKAEVQKMMSALGCPLKPDQTADLVNFLYDYNHRPKQSAPGQ